MKDEKKDTQNRETLTKMIYEEYKTFNLTKEQYSQVINRSIPSIDRDRAMSCGANFIKSRQGRVYYPIQAVVTYLLNVQKTLNSEEL